ncbi:MAG TPA: lipocalin family protein [Smithellaceae bacterium]|nr:lipocalin family protein [Smithellaceae bacterium]
MKKIILLLVLTLVSCAGIPEGVTPAGDFDLHRYLGRWHEIARLDHSFERGLSQVTAEYSLNPDGSVRVVNRGFSESENKWKQAEGRAVFVNRPDQGYLKVSFFGPFYGSYVVIDLDRENYSWAMVCGPDRSYLWILARSPSLDDAVVRQLTAKASALGFNTDALIFVHHD